MTTARHPLRPMVYKALLASSVSICTTLAGASAAGLPASPSRPVQPQAFAIDEGFDNVANLPNAGWLEQNNSEPLGASNWYQGTDAQFVSYDGDPTSYIAANYQNAGGDGTISNWLVTPLLTFNGSTSASFFTKSAGGSFADRLQIRLCEGADCSNVGTSSTDVGDFTTLLLDINPSYDPDGYPADWTQEVLAGLPVTGSGRIAFRYFVEDGGPSGTHGNYIGIDRFVFDDGSGGPGLPSLGTSFAPTSINAGQPSTLTITLQNPATVDATVILPFIDTFPAGMVVAPTANASTTCGTGTLLANPGDGSVMLGLGASIPAMSACAITVDVTAADAADYTNTIPAGALSTDQGINSTAASATLTVLPPLAPPSAMVTPATLSFTVAANGTASEPLSIANAAGSEELTYAVQGQGTAGKKPILLSTGRRLTSQNTVDMGKKKVLRPNNRPLSRFASNGVRVQHEAAPWAPRAADGSLTFQLDDGSAELAISLSDGTSQFPSVVLNRFAPPDGTGAFTIDSISIQWPDSDIAGGDLTGKQIDLLAYYDADSDGDPGNAVRLGSDTLITIAAPGTFETYTTNFSVPGAGDVYIGFEDIFASGGSTPILNTIGIDTDASQGDSYLAGQSDSSDPDINTLSNNGLLGTVGEVTGGQLDGNFLVRATGSSGGGAPCTGPIVSWLTASPSSGSVDAGSSVDVTVAVDPLAANLVPGDYLAEVCVTTNDPTQAVISVPVGLTVTAVPPASACGAADTIFCDGFEGSGGSGTVVTGQVDQVSADTADGSSLNLATGDFHPFDVSITADDINLYNGDPSGNVLVVYWYADVVPPQFSTLVGGVVDEGGQDYAVLQSGDTVGPASTIKAGNRPMTDWLGGVDGYVGIAFYNESTGAVNYGYIHLVTTAPSGYPANVLDYAFDSSGAAITIP